MKKVLSIILAVGMIISLCVMATPSAFADDTYVQNGMASSTIKYKQQSEYSILIPETIDTNVGKYTFQAGMLNIADNEKVYVTVDNADNENKIEFHHDNGVNTLSKQLLVEQTESSSVDLASLPAHCVGYFEGDEMASKIQFGLSEQSYDCSGIPKAGNYSATVNFNVYLAED